MTFKCPSCAREYDHRVLDQACAAPNRVINDTRIDFICSSCKNPVYVQLGVTASPPKSWGEKYAGPL